MQDNNNKNNREQRPSVSRYSGLIIFLVTVVLVILLVVLINRLTSSSKQTLSLTEFVAYADKNEVSKTVDEIIAEVKGEKPADNNSNNNTTVSEDAAKKFEEKQKMFMKVRSGEIRVLLGSTSKMGTGANAQKRLIALHHIDCPFRPSDLERASVKAA